jgi:Ser/Thr protein kinase RdoA (MazF antagonist)
VSSADGSNAAKFSPDFQSILAAFGLAAPLKEASELRAGNINTTYRVELCDGGEFILQRINHHVFAQPERIMDNIERVTAHLKTRMSADGGDRERKVLSFLRAGDGMIHWDADGEPWRCYIFVGGATAYNTAVKDVHLLQTGRAFGDFQRCLADFPIDTLHETIAGFHDTPRRYRAFEDAAAADRVNRRRTVAREIEFIRSRSELCPCIVSQLESGALPRRVTHNDTKINNVLIDDATDEAICVIDLDTVMPGSSLYDFGDMIRFGANTAVEDEADLSKIELDMKKYQLFTQGFLERAHGFMPADELLQLPLGVRLMTYELVIRFLTDYLDGDRYFRVDNAEHNLTRTRAQIRLLEDIERKMDRMTAFIQAKVESFGACYPSGGDMECGQKRIS